MPYSRTVVVVEDNPDDELMILDALEEQGIKNPVQVLRDGEEALDYFFCKGEFAGRQCSDLPVVVLMDINMPKVGGLDVLRQLRENPETSNLIVVMLTTSTEQDDIAKSYQYRSNSFVQKPVDYDDFLQTIKSLGHYWNLVNVPYLH